MIVLLICIPFFLATLALGYRVCLVGSKEKGWLAIIGIVIGVAIIISSIAGSLWSGVYLYKTTANMNMSAARPQAPGMQSQRGPRPSPRVTIPPSVTPSPK